MPPQKVSIMPANEGVPPENGQGNTEGNPFDYERGYNELRPEFTRVTQEAAELRGNLTEFEQFFEALSDPEMQRDALAALGIELGAGPSTENPDEFVDPLEQRIDQLSGVVNDLKTQRELEAEAEAESEIIAMRDDFIDESISFIEEQTNRKFTQKQESVLGNLAIAMAGDDGVPDVSGAYNTLYGNEGLLEEERTRWIDSKRAFSAPLGSAIPADQKPKTAAERVAYIDERLQRESEGY